MMSDDAAPGAPADGEALPRLRKVYVSRPVDARLTEALDHALLLSRSGGEGRGVVLVAPSGAGKTTMLKRCLANHPRIGHARGSENLIVKVTVPGPCTLKDLGRVIAEGVGYPIVTANPGHVWGAVRRRIAEEKVTGICLDEIQNISDTVNRNEAVKLRNTLKTLMNDPEHPVALVMAGQPSAAEFLRQDPQVARRLAFLQIEALRPGNGAMVAAMVRHLASAVGVGIAPGIAEALAGRLMHASAYQFGTATEIARAAVLRALRQGGAPPRLDRKHFADAHAAAKGNAHFANPFLAKDWQSLDPHAVLVTDPKQLVGPEHAPPGRRGRIVRPEGLQ